MPRVCLACQHPQREELERELIASAGAKQRQIGARFNLHAKVISRHWRHSVRPAAVEAAAAVVKASARDATTEITALISDLRQRFDEIKTNGEARAVVGFAREISTAVVALGRLSGQIGGNVNVGFFGVGAGRDLETLDNIPLERFGVGRLTTAFHGTTHELRALKFAAMVKHYSAEPADPEELVRCATEFLQRRGAEISWPVQKDRSPSSAAELEAALGPNEWRPSEPPRLPEPQVPPEVLAQGPKAVSEWWAIRDMNIASAREQAAARERAERDDGRLVPVFVQEREPGLWRP